MSSIASSSTSYPLPSRNNPPNIDVLLQEEDTKRKASNAQLSSLALCRIPFTQPQADPNSTTTTTFEARQSTTGTVIVTEAHNPALTSNVSISSSSIGRSLEVQGEIKIKAEEEITELVSNIHDPIAEMQKATTVARFWQSEGADPLRHSGFPKIATQPENLTKDQRRAVGVVNLNVDQGRLLPHLESRVTTALAYVKDHPKQVGHHIMKHSAEAIGFCGSLGSCTGGFIGSLANAPKVGARIGGGIGATLGVLIMLPFSIHSMGKSPIYLSWKADREKMLKDAKIKKFFEDDEILKRLVCDIIKKIPEKPVCVYWPQQNLYSELTFEYDKICAWLRENPRKLYPGMRRLFTEEHLTFDVPYINGVRERLRQLRVKVDNSTPTGAMQNVINGSLRKALPIDLNQHIGGFVQERNSTPLAEECIKRDLQLLQLARPHLIDIINKLGTRLANHEISETTYIRKIMDFERYVTSVKRIEFTETNWLKRVFGSRNYTIRLDMSEDEIESDRTFIPIPSSSTTDSTSMASSSTTVLPNNNI